MNDTFSHKNDRAQHRISVLVVDDSAVVRQVVAGILDTDPDIKVIGAVSDPLFAMERMKIQWPDVLVLDIEMPRMDGMTFLKKIMSERPTPVVICSSLTELGAHTSLAALAAGAVAVIGKPRLGIKQFLNDTCDEFIRTVKEAANSNLTAIKPVLTPQKFSADVILSTMVEHGAMSQTTERVVAMGCSTGGTQALEYVLTALPKVSPGIVIVQHMPEKFTAAFAARLNMICRIDVKEAEQNDRVMQGRALIALGDKHMILKRTGAQYAVELLGGPPVNRHRPSVDVLFRSVANNAGPNALGIIMTGMGDDGAAGLLEMRQAGARTIAQDEASCVVYGMPREAVNRGAVEKIVPLNQLEREIHHYFYGVAPIGP